MKERQHCYCFKLASELYIFFCVNQFLTNTSNLSKKNLNRHKVLDYTTYKFELVDFPNIWKYGPEQTPYLDTFHAVRLTSLKSLFKSHQIAVL